VSSHGYGGIAHLTIHYTTTSDNGTLKYVDAEILSMNVSGGSFPAGVQFRESPTLVSGGQLSSEVWQGALNLHADLDVYTELSLNGGQTWTPANSVMHMIYYESTPTKEPTWGGLKATYR